MGTGFVCNFVETKLGIDAEPLLDFLGDFSQEKKDVLQKRKDKVNYDAYFEFRKILAETRKDLAKLSEEKPVIIVVDELDRCLPEYAITVLERLHHLFDQQENIVVILAIDKTRLSAAIQKVYGIDSNSVPDFLRKYISFSLDVGKGSISEAFWERYSEYLSMFDKASNEEMDELNKLVSALFSDMDIRLQEKTLENCLTLHKLACTGITDLSLLYFELIHQIALSRVPSIGYLSHLAELNRTTMKPFEEKLGNKPYEYLKTLEKMSVSQHRHLQINNRTYKLLVNTVSGRAFWLLTRIQFPLKGALCHHYSGEELVCGDDCVEAAQFFHELACLMN